MARPRDTSPEAWARYIGGIRATAPEDRVRRAIEMSDDLREIVRAGIRSRHPGWTTDQVQRGLEDLMLGKGLARRAREARHTPSP